ncbi:monovalent cation/H(+) antiporter subunit G [Salisediminibacterium selenitireducens]|uniref:Monovalent cation/proton antiporter, MnhG/PhaG subunit n=1 Tax=Bacillus selenitireducens (strain ATCC 700615 / DSM 15326 / MLS10) TaxID=439292 RepID=D6XWE0_BACIE|nr:monovalent cation/H(+) antiporter subunit G [Salisediminibacterium selenitireducens]ADH99894.1 monovalent cation/proton antiporter, MnhG/PhaG subunit [[Bacillus] selenitireducens MLS10]
MTEIVISVFLIMGAALSLLGAIGIVRFPDVYGRLHAATKSATLGVISIITGVFLFFLWIDGIVVGKLLLTIIFVFLTAPVAAFMIARSAYNTNVKMWGNNQQDDLAEAMKKQKKQG